jgi:hypothetical protein
LLERFWFWFVIVVVVVVEVVVVVVVVVVLYSPSFIRSHVLGGGAATRRSCRPLSVPRDALPCGLVTSMAADDAISLSISIYSNFYYYCMVSASFLGTAIGRAKCSRVGTMQGTAALTRCTQT